MAHEYSISDFGLKLIKAYEGFRPVETVLVSGQRVIGYGHHYVPGEVSVVTKKKAAELLKTDLEPYEDMINHTVFAPLSQSQFDALVSLTFNIGAKEFANSNVLHHLNNGQVLAAAAGFDEWRKSEIIGKTYVIDALVRRRTAEKALFLSPATGVVAAPRNEIPPINDSTAPSGADDIEVFYKSDARGYVDQTPYAVGEAQNRRKEDKSSGVLTLSERYVDVSEDGKEIDGENIGDEKADDVPWVDETVQESIVANETFVPAASDIKTEKETEKNLSPIAVAAAEVSERLDNLMAGASNVDRLDTGELDLIDGVSKNSIGNISDLITEDVTMSRLDRPNLTLVEAYKDEADALDIDIVDEITAVGSEEGTGDAPRDIAKAPKTKKAKVERSVPKTSHSKDNIESTNGIGAYWTALVVGLTLLGGGLWKMKFSTASELDDMSSFLVPVAMLVGAMMILGGLYYLLKAQLKNT